MRTDPLPSIIWQTSLSKSDYVKDLWARQCELSVHFIYLLSSFSTNNDTKINLIGWHILIKTNIVFLKCHWLKKVLVDILFILFTYDFYQWT